MKKILSLLLILCTVLCALPSCGDGGNLPKLDADVDCNFTGLSTNEIYGTVAAIMNNPKDYEGKSVAITAQYSTVYNFSENRCQTPIIIALDPTNCCDAYYEIRTADGIYPELGETASFIGTFNAGGYIDVTEIIRYTDGAPTYDFDAITMTVGELKAAIDNYCLTYKTSELNGKTVRIIGHHSVNGDYKFLSGLDGSGKVTWNIELTVPNDDTVLPMPTGNVVNPVEIIGVFSYYTEGEHTYACIEVKDVSKTACVFK